MAKQQALTVLVPIIQGKVEALHTLLTEIGNDIEGNSHVRFRLTPSTHFARWAILDKQPEFGPWLYFSACYDGDFASYMRQLTSNIGEGMEPIWMATEGYRPGTCSDPDAFGSFLRRYSFTPNIFLRAFPTLSVNDILGNAARRRIADRYLDSDPLSISQIPITTLATPKSFDRAPNDRSAKIVNWLNGIDPASRTPNTNVVTDARLLEIEDKPAVVQNQMTVISKVKPGFKAWLLIRLFMLIGAITDKPNSRGQLSGLLTIHFARWVLVNGGRHLLFESNYDGSWENYIDDFGDHASTGMNAVWGCCTGFPLGGSLDIESFKQVIRAHQFPTLTFYSAYPDLTVENIASDRDLSRRGLIAGIPSGRS